MSRLSFGSAISAVALASLLASCAAPGSVQSAGAGKAGEPKLGFATRALVALNSGDATGAVGFAEQAVERSPQDVGVRALLGNAYFAAGRFASADAAFRDALRLDENQPKILLKLALVDIALGKTGEANAFLDGARSVLDPADYGLGLALAGRAAEAVGVLEALARMRGADARVRQNLALSHALAGNWDAARTIAAQDVPADQLDARIQDWMRLASAPRPSDQIAALTGVAAAAADPGQPARLALVPNGSIAVAQTQVAAPIVQADVLPADSAGAAANLPPVLPVASAEVSAVAPLASLVDNEAFVELRPTPVAAAPAVQPAAKSARPLLRAAAYVPKKPLARSAAVRSTGKSGAVVQLGAYGSPQRVATAWNSAARRYSALRAYMPVSARFDSPKGTFYRLSVKGFHSPDQAKNLCIALRRSGGTCFVRNVAGDAPVQLALR